MEIEKSLREVIRGDHWLRRAHAVDKRTVRIEYDRTFGLDLDLDDSLDIELLTVRSRLPECLPAQRCLVCFQQCDSADSAPSDSWFATLIGFGEQPHHRYS